MVPNLIRRSTPKARPERRADEKRRGILRAAAASFRARGFAATGMREIAEAADLSTPNLYYYFDSKQALLYYCQDHSLDRMLAACAAEKKRRSTPAATLREVIRAHALCMLDELDGASAHLEVDALSPAMRKKIVAKRDRYEDEVRRIVESGIRSRAFVACDATLVTRAILGALNWTARWYRPGGATTPDDLATVFADYLVRGLLK